MKYFTGFIAFAAALLTSALAQSSTFQEPIEGELYSETNRPGMYCLAINIYHEARADNLAGQYAVADVVLNRVKDSRYPDTICEVVMQGPVRESWKTRDNPDLSDSERKYVPVRHKCQFSWYCDGRSDKTHDLDSWRKAQEVAYRIIELRNYRGISEGATHYHATYVSPKWANELDQVGRIGAHVFYRWP